MCRTWGSNSGPLACQADSLPIELPRPDALPGKCFFKEMVQIGSPEDKNEKLNERVTNLEEQPKTIENISDIVRKEVR